MARLADFLHAWWRGDYIYASFAKTVSVALRALAYETMVAAKKRIERRQLLPVERFDFKKSGKYRFRRVRQIRYGIDRKGKRYRLYLPSQPGQSPTNQRGILKNSIKYAFRGSNTPVGDYSRALSMPGSSQTVFGTDGMQEAFVGAVTLPSSKHWSFTDGMAPHALEWGGWSRNHKGRMVRIEARPYMRPAGAEVLESSLLRRMLEGSLSRQSQTRPTSSIGWMRT